MTEMKINIKKQIVTIFFLAALPFASSHAQQNYPTRPVRLIVTVPPGGAADLVARVMAQKLGDAFSQTFVVDNRAGGGGQIAGELAAKAAPDGYTLLQPSITTHGIGPHVYDKLLFDPVKDFSPVVLYATMPMIVVTNAQVPVKSIKEMIALAKGKPGAYAFGSSGSGGAPHLVGELFKGATGIDIQHVPYKGSGPAATDVAGGQVAFSFDAIAPHLPHIKSGRTRVLAAISPQRLALFPEVPTMKEIGYPQVAASIWYGLMAPAGTPKPIVAKLNVEANRVLGLQDVKERMAGAGIDAAAPNQPEDFAKFVRDELAKWGPVVKAAGAKAG
jgi:tripartite-type tricarboxylate transporter receptor subunit TctC